MDGLGQKLDALHIWRIILKFGSNIAGVRVEISVNGFQLVKVFDAASGWILDELDDGKPAPKASPLESIILDPGGFVSMLILDMDAYSEKYGEKAVRKNLTIPAWLNTFAENNHINFSQVLQDSLTALYQQTQQV